ncbi:hypothetical protein C8J57DRAFT_1466728 [Mycena rebaudengoi]|nr:hypothetical protein C8J57DRAFT_1466728 [Mycena rebaudengoi]
MYLNNNDLCEFFNLLPARDLDPPKAARPLDQSLPLSTITIAHHIHIPPRRRLHIHSSLQTDMLTTEILELVAVCSIKNGGTRRMLSTQYEADCRVPSWSVRAELRIPPIDDAAPPSASGAGRAVEKISPLQNRMKPIALPPQLAGVSAVKLSPLLRCGAAGQWAPMPVDISWPRSPTAASKPDERALSELATCPGLPALTVISELLPWPITVHASGIRLRWVTVADVLGAIHDALSLHVDERQFMDWVSYEGNEAQRRLRYRRGMTRLDLLGGQTRFAGLSESKMGCDIWVLNLA